ncbi:alternative ribosome rescue aminoacyl-tRNA hydrolase ArfB [Neotamlana laminarinivorans]|uniref:Aminoacyl-tRNA hydrolase n=1 Tax=Neotamlana laminarinivorans TaxID=2883124 RepID=A0A9X1L5T8_9FLAO|nr:alternative ribosome rescue aminoacyl-tRNA hydrolase ArfB [Tamlana laminarinivorans]MCB4799781.1 aminoacyl-tRNA hydrolase [Tamlana laminarinivorans]
MKFNEDALLQELTFKAIRSSGSGGQHVNKVSSKIELIFHIPSSQVLTDLQKFRIEEKLKNRINNDGYLMLQCGETRSQHKNKAIITQRFLELIKGALVVRKKRIKTKVPKSVIKKRLNNKKHNAEKKANRRKPNLG